MSSVIALLKNVFLLYVHGRETAYLLNRNYNKRSLDHTNRYADVMIFSKQINIFQIGQATIIAKHVNHDKRLFVEKKS